MERNISWRQFDKWWKEWESTLWPTLNQDLTSLVFPPRFRTTQDFPREMRAGKQQYCNRRDSDYVQHSQYLTRFDGGLADEAAVKWLTKM